MPGSMANMIRRAREFCGGRTVAISLRPMMRGTSKRTKGESGKSVVCVCPCMSAGAGGMICSMGRSVTTIFMPLWIRKRAHSVRRGGGKPPRRPIRIVHTRTVYFGHGGRPHPTSKTWLWLVLGMGVLAVVIVARAPMLALLIGVGAYYFWRKQNGRG